MKFFRSVLVPVMVLLFACQKKEKQQHKEAKDSAGFTVLTHAETGLNFNNKLEETTSNNGFYYEYFYNGGGVAVADFNNDGLQDVYFVSNLRTNKLYLNLGELRFRNVSVKAKAQGGRGFGTGATVVDINNDGLKDIYLLKSGPYQQDEPLKNELLINLGVDENNIPVFEEKAADYGLDLPHHSTQASFFDYDRDGDLDMFLINHNIAVYEIGETAEVMQGYSPKIGEKLFRNDQGKYVEVTHKAGIVSNNLGFGLGVAIGDVNNDSWPDVYVGNDYYEKDHLYINNQNGTFTEVALQSFNHVSTFSMGNDLADINNDGLLDIVAVDMMAEDNYTQKASMSGMNVEEFYNIERLGLHRQYMYNTLQLNIGTPPGHTAPAFSDIAQLAGISSTDWSWAPLLFDMDNDGYRDLFISNGIKRDFRNNDFQLYLEKKYQEGIRNKNLNLESHINDLLEKLPNRKKENYFYLNKQSLRFEKIKQVQPPTYSNGAAYADFDNDGDLDLVVNNVDDFALLYRNDASGNHFLKVTLTGVGKNRDALGARVEAIAGSQRRIAENYYSRGFQSAMAVPLHFGLGKAGKVDTLRITWPDGKQQSLYNVEAGQELKIEYSPNAGLPSKMNHSYRFKEVTRTYGIDYEHKENQYNDFEKESLLPHRMSQAGPCLAVGDVNGDGLEDFFIGGAKEQPAALYIQSNEGTFYRKNSRAIVADKHHEDTGAILFDADGDGDLDLYVVSGGNEKEPNDAYYQDRLYTNNGKGEFDKNLSALPALTTSGQVVKAADYDKDGDLDLFVGSRVNPGNYGYPAKSYLLANESTQAQVVFRDVTATVLPELQQYGMVTAALWQDIDADSVAELVVAQEWGAIQVYKLHKEKYVNVSQDFGTADQVGWWYSLATDDIDGDGDLDIIAGNLGLNYKYKASPEAPFHLYLNDFDGNTSKDIVLGYQQQGKLYPLRGRECMSNQMPFVKKKFKTYDAFAKAELKEIYGEELDNSRHMAATHFASAILLNKDNQKFIYESLPDETQVSSVNQILVANLNKDQKKDLLLFGNLYGSEVETPRNDVSYGHFLVNEGNAVFRPMAASKSGLYVRGEVKGASFIRLGKEGRKAILLARNNEALVLLEILVNQKI